MVFCDDIRNVEEESYQNRFTLGNDYSPDSKRSAVLRQINWLD